MNLYPLVSSPTTFFMEFPASGVTLRCACEASGSFTHPKFHASKTFLCGHNATQDSAVGTISGSKITKGQYFDGFTPFHTWVYQCKPSPTC